MTIETRLGTAAEDLDGAVRRTVVPPSGRLHRHSRRRFAALSLSGLALFVVLVGVTSSPHQGSFDEPLEPLGPAQQGRENPSGPPADGRHSEVPWPIQPAGIVGPIRIADLESNRSNVLSELTFDPNILGTEWPLQTVADPIYSAGWMLPQFPLESLIDKTWTFIGEEPETGLTVVALETPVWVEVCAGIQAGQHVCRKAANWTFSPGPLGLPTVWHLLQDVAVVGFEERDRRLWQIATEGVVAFTRTETNAPATLTAYDREGNVIATYVTNDFVEVDDLVGDHLPDLPTKALMQVLLQEGVAAVVDITEINEGTTTENVAATEVHTIRLDHADGTVSYAVLETEGEIGQAIWTMDAEAIGSAFIEGGVAITYQLGDGPNSYTVADNLIIVRVIPTLEPPSPASAPIWLPIP